MKIKISDMMDQATEYSEDLTSAGPDVDFDRVKQSVMKKAQAKPAHKKSILFYARTAAAVFAVVLAVTGTTVIAKGLLPLGGLVTKDTIDEITEPEVASSYAEMTTASELAAFSETVDSGDDIPQTRQQVGNPYEIESEKDLERDRVCFTYTSANGTYSIPDFYLGNGAFAEFHADSQTGLYLRKGQTVTLQFSQEDAANPDTEDSSADIGYTLNGQYTGLLVSRDPETSCSFTAPASGNYVIVLSNFGVSRTIYKNITVTVHDK